MAFRQKTLFKRSTRLKDFVETFEKKCVDSRALRILQLSDAATSNQQLQVFKLMSSPNHIQDNEDNLGTSYCQPKQSTPTQKKTIQDFCAYVTDLENNQSTDVAPAGDQTTEYQPNDVAPAGRPTAEYQPGDVAPTDDQTTEYQPKDVAPAGRPTAEYQPGGVAPTDDQTTEYQPKDVAPAGRPTVEYQPGDVAPTDDQTTEYQPNDGMSTDQNMHNLSGELMVPEGFTYVRLIGIRAVQDESSGDSNSSHHLILDNTINDGIDMMVPSDLVEDSGNETVDSRILKYLKDTGLLRIEQDSERGSSIQSDVSAKTRKCQRNVEKHKKVICKRLRNSGQEYVSSSGTVCEARVLGPSCSCGKQCFEVLSLAHCQTICEEFWNTGHFDSQNAYLFGQIRCFAPVRRRESTNTSDCRKQHTFAYYVKSSMAHEVRVCKEAFLSIHGLHRNAGRVENILTQIATGNAVPKSDGRGKHHNRPNRTTGDVLESVKSHIRSFPVYQSHYSRRDNINRVYLGEDLNIARMHRLYEDERAEKSWPKVTSDVYRKIFCENFNIGFKLPQTDTCKVCDELTTQTSVAVDNEKMEIERKLADHRRKAGLAFEILRNFSKYAGEHPSEVCSVCFDLQQALPTPKLSCGPAFYKRKLWTYNLCIHDNGNNRSVTYVWPETIAGRGSNEIASCLLHYFKTNERIEAKKLVVFSDNCSGQNKNFTILSLWQYLVALGKFNEIQHIFPVSGHTMMPCDRDFGDIERKLRKTKSIFSPTEYVQLIQEARTKNKFQVVEMTSANFVNVGMMSSLLTKRTITTEKEKVDYRLVSQFKVSPEYPQSLQVRFSHDDSENWKVISLQKRGRPNKLSEFKFQPILNVARPVPKAKADDVMSLLPYIPPVHHSFYNGIIVDRLCKDNGVEIADGNDDCDS